MAFGIPFSAVIGTRTFKRCSKRATATAMAAPAQGMGSGDVRANEEATIQVQQAQHPRFRNRGRSERRRRCPAREALIQERSESSDETSFADQVLQGRCPCCGAL
jgi:hypothetical protein